LKETIYIFINNSFSQLTSVSSYRGVAGCFSVKDMWEIIEVTHEGTFDVKRVKKHELVM